jgi:hypothetical protein
MQSEAEYCAAEDQHGNRPPFRRLPHQVHGIHNEKSGEKRVSDHRQFYAGVDISLPARNHRERNRDGHGEQERDLPRQRDRSRDCRVLHAGLISQSRSNT